MRLALLLATLGAGTLTSLGGTSMVVTTNYYRVVGTNTMAIRQSMLERRPWQTNFAYDAKTEWDARFSFTCRQSGNQWVLGGSDVKTRVTITLPQWVPAVPVTHELAAIWQQYFQGLSRHEQGHLQWAREATARAQRRLEALPACGSMQDLTAAAKRAATQAVEECRQKEREYDELTHHGQTQGAVLHVRPPGAGG